MRTFVIAFSWLFLVLAGSGNAATSEGGKKVALVIGNSVYTHAVALPNPENDARRMAAKLRDAGFTVIEGENLDKVGMGRVIDEFTETAYDADVSLIYYAGHGLQVDQQNYLIPVDVQLEKAAHLQSRTISVDYLLSKLPADPAVNILILDACRDNPLARALAAVLPKSRSSSVGAGLAAVQASSQSSGVGGLLIAYATDPGAVAYDGNGTNSPYTAALTRHLTTPGLELQSAFTRVRAEVSEETHGAQRPWVSASLAREVYLGGKTQPIEEPPPEVKPAAPQAQSVDTVEQATWEEASKRNTITHYEYYLSRFPGGQFAGLARINIDQLRTAEAKARSVQSTDTEIAALSAEVPKTESGVAADTLRQVPGTPETEASLKLDKQDRIDLQLRLSALDYDIGDFDGSLGMRTRAAIGDWQQKNDIVPTTYLTPQQHLLLVTQTNHALQSVIERNHVEERLTKKEKSREQPRKREVAKEKLKPTSTAKKADQKEYFKEKATAENDSTDQRTKTGKLISRADLVYCKRFKKNIVHYQNCLGY